MFDPQPGELTKFRNAEIYFRIGPVFTFENVLLEKIGAGNPDLEIVDCSKGISTENNNPHIWLDPGKVKIIAENIFVKLVEKFPDKTEEFLRNKNDFISEIDSLDERLKLDFAQFKNRQILTYHPAWGYFTGRYGIREIAIEKDGKTPSAKELAGLIKFARESRINTIFLEPQFDRDIVQSLAEQLDLKIVEIDPLAYDFIANLKKVSGQFIESF
jgi:zinc transport system substrate-binding protein